ncbi:MAG TPA: hypothetical protein VFZ59_14950 [Verrucomicrobiae bacterium]|nr:hypothetical protein [Verrucomicrobiae bacterium]
MKSFSPAIIALIAVACFVFPAAAGTKEKDKSGKNSGNTHKDKKHPHQPPKHGHVRLSTPAQLQAEATSESQVNLTWKDKSNNELGFAVERTTGRGKYVPIARLPANATAYQDKELQSDTCYCYRVRAFNAAGHSDYSATACATTFKAETNCALLVTSWGASLPTPIPPRLTDVVAVASGNNQSLALKKDGTVVAWTHRAPSPTPLPQNLSSVTAIAAGYAHGVALKQNGTVVTWESDFDRLKNTPQPANLTGVKAIAAGAYHTLALKQDGSVVGWGDDSYGAATPPPNLTGVKAIAAGENFSLALQTNGTLVSWGLAPSDAPSQITNAVALAAGQNHALVLLGDGTVMGWPSANTAGTPPTGLSNVVAISAVRNTSLALKQDGTVVGWGDPFGGSMPPDNLAGVTAIAAGSSFHLAVSTTPNPPLDFAAQIVATNRVRLVWTPQPRDRSLVQIERALGNLDPGVATNWAPIASVAQSRASYDDTSVSGGSNYWYRVRSVTTCGQSVYSQPIFIDIFAPAFPPFLSANAFVDQVRLAASPAHNGLLGFRIERAPDKNGNPGVWKRILVTNTTDVSSHTFTDTGLTVSNRYWYRAQFFNGLGDSPYSEPTSVRILPPQPPININAYILRSNRILLSWLPPAADDQDGYKLERTTNALNGSEIWTKIATVNNQSFLPYFVDAAVSPGSTFSYRIRCFNKLGHSPFSAPFSVEIVAPPPPDLSVYAFGNQAKLFWSMNYSGQLEGFLLQRAPDGSGAPGDWTALAAITNSAYYAYTDPGLQPGGIYWYRVQAISWTGLSEFSSPVAVTIVAPAAPFNLTATPDDTNAIILSWAAGFPFDQHGFKIERSTNVLSSWSEIATVAATNRSFSQYRDGNFIANATNYYRVRAFNPLGVSDYSEVAEAVIHLPSGIASEFVVHPLITSLTLTNDNVLVTWTAPAGSSVVETAPGPRGPFSGISASLTTGNTTTVGAYLDVGARTNAVARFYRISATVSTWQRTGPVLKSPPVSEHSAPLPSQDH